MDKETIQSLLAQAEGIVQRELIAHMDLEGKYKGPMITEIIEKGREFLRQNGVSATYLTETETRLVYEPEAGDPITEALSFESASNYQDRGKIQATAIDKFREKHGVIPRVRTSIRVLFKFDETSIVE